MTTYSTRNGSQPLAIALGDINNDTLLDIVVANSGTDTIGIFLGYHNGSFVALTTYSTEKDLYPVSVAISDFNSDQWLDIDVANFGTNKVGPDHANGYLCKHIIFVLHRVLKVDRHSPLLYQKALLTIELNEIFAKANAQRSGAFNNSDVLAEQK
ncbi:unnamed protein product, partial [Rotaria sordida]